MQSRRGMRRSAPWAARAGVQLQTSGTVLGGCHGRLEESIGSRIDWCSGNIVHEKTVSGGRVGDGGWSGGAGGGISGEIRRVRQSLPGYFEHGMRVMEMAEQAGKRI